VYDAVCVFPSLSIPTEKCLNWVLGAHIWVRGIIWAFKFGFGGHFIHSSWIYSSLGIGGIKFGFWGHNLWVLRRIRIGETATYDTLLRVLGDNSSLRVLKDSHT
jgi:hypothetical protein